MNNKNNVQGNKIYWNKSFCILKSVFGNQSERERERRIQRNGKFSLTTRTMFKGTRFAVIYLLHYEAIIINQSESEREKSKKTYI